MRRRRGYVLDQTEKSLASAARSSRMPTSRGPNWRTTHSPRRSAWSTSFFNTIGSSATGRPPFPIVEADQPEMICVTSPRTAPDHPVIVRQALAILDRQAIPVVGASRFLSIG